MKKVNLLKYFIIPFLLCLIYFFLYFTKIEFFPDLLLVYSKNNFDESLNTIVSSLASISGLIIAVIILAYEFLKNKLERIAFRYFINNEWLIIFISLFLSTIIIAFMSAIIIPIDSEYNNNEINIIYLNIILFLTCLASLFPLTFLILNSLTPTYIIKKEIKNLNSKNKISINKGDDTFKTLEFLDNSPLEILNSICSSYTRNKDDKLPQLIIIEVAKSYLMKINNAEDKNNKYIEQLIKSYRGYFDDAFSSENERVLICILNSIFHIQTNIKDKKIQLESLKLIKEKIINSAIEKSIKNKNQLIYKYILDLVNDIFEHYFVTIDEEDLPILIEYNKEDYEEIYGKKYKYKKGTYEDSSLWNELINEYLNIYLNQLESNLKNNRLDNFNICCENLHDLQNDIKYPKAGYIKEAFISIKITSLLTEYYIKALKNKLISNSIEAKYFKPLLLEHLITVEGKKYARSLLIIYCNAILDLKNKNLIDYYIVGGMKVGGFGFLSSLGFLGKRCSIEYGKNQVVKDCLNDIIETWSVLKKEFNQENDEKSIYRKAINENLENIKYWFKKYNNPNRKIIIKINKIIRLT